MEELKKLKKQTKMLKYTFLTILIIDIILLGIVYIQESKNPSSPPPLQDIAMKVFNSNFEKYAGKQKGQAIKSLITVIKYKNEQEMEHKVQVIGITETSEILNNEYYNVKLKYSDSGYINKIIIEKSEE